MDCTFYTDEGVLNFRVCAVVIHDNCLLATRGGGTPYYFLPGGRVKIGETVDEAIVRETKEEFDADVKIVRPLWFYQDFYTEEVCNKRFHEICVYYLVDVSQTDLPKNGCFVKIEENDKINYFEWLPFDRVKTEKLHPSFIKEKLYDLPETLTIGEIRE